MLRSLPLAVAAAGIAVILLAMLAGPAFSPAEFSWITHSTSEQAGQHMKGAWIMRVGFLGFALGTGIAAFLDRKRRPWVRLALGAFALGMLGAALWSNAPIPPELPADMVEDWLHSLASGVVGTSFAAACAARLFAPGGARGDPLSWAGVVLSVALPLAMLLWPEWRGLLQRIMFGVSFIYILREFAPGPRGARPGARD